MSSLPAKTRPKAPALLPRTTTMMSVVSAPHPAALESEGVSSDMRFVFENVNSHAGNGMTTLAFVALATVALGAMAWVTIKAPREQIAVAPVAQIPLETAPAALKDVHPKVHSTAQPVVQTAVDHKPLFNTSIFLNPTVVPFQASKPVAAEPATKNDIPKPVAIPAIVPATVVAQASNVAAPVVSASSVRLAKLKNSFEEWASSHKEAQLQVSFDPTKGLMVSFETEWLFKVNSPGMRPSKLPAVQHWANAIGESRTEFKSMTVMQWLGDSASLRKPDMSKARRNANLEILRKKLSSLAWVNQSSTSLKDSTAAIAPHASPGRTAFLFQ